MTLRLERSEKFWDKVINDSTVKGSLDMSQEDFFLCISNPRVTPLVTENGGYLIIDLGIGLISEFHGVYTDKGRGKEAYQAACDLAEIIFDKHSMAITYESLNPNSRPPLTFGFKSEDMWLDTSNGPMRLWYLTKANWRSSPTFKRMSKKCLLQL